MSAYTAQITAYVNAQYTDALGYNSAMRAGLIAFGDDEITTLVTPEFFADERDQAIDEKIALSIYSTLFGSQLTKFKKFCEYCLDLAIQGNTPPATQWPTGTQIFMGTVDQLGTAAPTFTETYNTFGIAPVGAYVSPGTFTAAFPGKIPAGYSVMILLTGI